MSKTIENYTTLINSFTRGGFAVQVTASTITLSQNDEVAFEGTIDQAKEWFTTLCILRGAHFKQVVSLKRWIYFWRIISAVCLYLAFCHTNGTIQILTIVACVLGAFMWIFNAIHIFRTNRKLFLDIK